MACSRQLKWQNEPDKLIRAKAIPSQGAHDVAESLSDV